TLTVRFPLPGGGPQAIPKIEMGVATGGLIHQSIEKDTHLPSKWRPNDTLTVNVQIVNSQAFQAITGAAPPESPIDASTYASLGLSFFKLYDENPLSISGAFTGVNLFELSTSTGIILSISMSSN
ncbi:MAG: hypothetical protein M1839_000958, partial [Geoglossum umbratile]